MNKQETIEEINRLPIFSKQPVKVNDVYQNRWIGIVEVGKDQAISIPTPRYNLVQLKEVLIPAQQDLDEYDANIKYNEGIVIMDIFPQGDEYKDENYAYGLSVFNSVTSETGIGIRFSVLLKGQVLRFPAKSLGRFYKTHSNKEALKITKDYLGMLKKVKDTWRTIVTEFPKASVKLEDVDSIADSFGISLDTRETIKQQIQKGVAINMWTVTIFRFNEIVNAKSKSEVHKALAFDEVTKQIWAYALALRIGI